MNRSLHPATQSQRGFTLVELLVVVTVIGILMGLLLPGLSLLKKRQKLATLDLRMREISQAVNDYLLDYPLLGDGGSVDSADFAAAPLTYLVHRPRAAGRQPYLEISLSFVGRAENGRIIPVQSPAQATSFDDGFGGALQFEIRNAPAGGPYEYTDLVVLRAPIGNSRPEDDVRLGMCLSGDFDGDGSADQGKPKADWVELEAEP